ncbi:hypothetical protein ACI76O_11825, partial [Capnocytophaga cynodegmi]
FKKDETKKGTFRTLMDYAQETTFAHTDWKQINDPKLKIYAFQGQNEGEAYSYNYSLQHLLDWLKKNKGRKVTFNPYSTEYRWRGSQHTNSPSSVDFVNGNKKRIYIKELICNTKTDELDLSANGNVVNRTGFDVQFNWDTTDFYMYIYYAEGKNPAITIRTKSYESLRAVLDYIDFEITQRSQNHIMAKYQEQFKKVDNDPDKIDAIFETIPDFVVTNFSQDELATSLKSIAQTTISGKTTFGTNEEKAILNIVKALGDKNPDLLLNTLSKNRKGNKSDSPYLFEVLYKNMDNVGGDDNFTTYIQLLYKYWLKSNYSNKEVQDYIPYNSEKSWGFYSDNVKTSLIYDKIHLQITNKENTYVPPISYHLYDKVNLLSLNQNTDGLKFPSKEIPAFYLMAVKEVNKGTNIQTGLGLTFDAVTTISGVGNLAKLRYLSGVVKGVKTAIAGIEISSGVLNAMITLSDCESDFCNDLRTYLFWLEMASLGADTFTQQQIRQSAEKALKSADNSLSKEIKEELARVSKSVDDVVDITKKVYRNVKYDDFIKTFKATDEQYKTAFKLWGEEKWDELYKYFKDNDLNNWEGIIWPPFNGAKGIIKTEKGEQLAGKVFDRFQKYEDLSGGFASPVPNNSAYTIQSRALGVNYDEMEELGQSYYYIKFKIKDASPDLNFEYGEAVPWFNELGGGIQIKSSKNFRDIKNNIEILEKWRFNAGKWEELKLIDGIWK